MCMCVALRFASEMKLGLGCTLESGIIAVKLPSSGGNACVGHSYSGQQCQSIMGFNISNQFDSTRSELVFVPLFVCSVCLSFFLLHSDR